MSRSLRRKQKKLSDKRRRKVRLSAADKLRCAYEQVQAGRYREAYDGAAEVLCSPGNKDVIEDALRIAGHAAIHLEPLDAAIAAQEKLAAIASDQPQILNDLGGLLCQAGRYDDAEAALRGSLALMPGDSHTLANLGQVHLGRQEYELAEEVFRKAIEASDSNAHAYSGLGTALDALDRPMRSIEAYKRANILLPDNWGIRQNYEAMLRAHGVGYEDLERLYKSALIKDPEDAVTGLRLACVYRDTGRQRKAWDLLKEWMTREPELQPDEQAQMREIIGEMQFLDNDFSSAWENYHWRLARRERLGGQPMQPEWRGQPLDGKSVFVYAEQGVGDQVMFMALLPVLIAHAARIALECDPRLVALFERSFPTVSCIPVEDPASPMTLDASIDYSVAMGSLGCWLWKDYCETPPVAYIKADNERRQALRQRYLKGETLRLVGLAWKSPLGKKAHAKSLMLEDLAPLASMENTKFIDLQYGDTKDDREWIRDHLGVEIFHDNCIDQWTDIDGFAAQISALDGVITVSNSTAHLAGALGVKTAVILPFGAQWKWGGSGETSVWYPNVSLLRRVGDLGPVPQIKAALSVLTQEP